MNRIMFENVHYDDHLRLYMKPHSFIDDEHNFGAISWSKLYASDINFVEW